MLSADDLELLFQFQISKRFFSPLEIQLSPHTTNRYDHRIILDGEIDIHAEFRWFVYLLPQGETSKSFSLPLLSICLNNEIKRCKILSASDLTPRLHCIKDFEHQSCLCWYHRTCVWSKKDSISCFES